MTPAGIRGVGQKSNRTRALELHREGTLNPSEIARALDVEEEQVRAWIWPGRAAIESRIPAHKLKNAPAAHTRPGAGHEGTSSVSSSNYRYVPGVGQPSARTRAVELRKQGLSYQRIADQLGVTQMTAHRWINGRKSHHRKYLDCTCKDCGAEFTRRSDSPGSTDLCFSCATRRRRRRVEVVCRHCGKQFEVRQSVLNKPGGGHYCSRRCRADAIGAPSKLPGAAAKISRAKLGSRNAMFKDGLSEHAVSRVFNLKLKGEPSCRNCGKPAVDLHHAIPRSMCRASIKDLRNGLPLCRRCHNGWHGRRIPIYRDIFTREEWDYLSSVKLTGQRIEAWLDDRYPARTTGLPE